MNARISATIVLVGIGTAQALGADADREWRQWRGPQFNGVAARSNPPVEWSESKNIRWKVSVPGDGLSAPLVWNNLIILQTAVPTGKDAEGKSISRDVPAEGEARAGRRGEGRRGDTPPGERQGRRGRRGRGGRSRAAPTEVHQFNVMAFDRRTGKTVWERTVREMVPHEGSHQDGSLAPASPVTDGNRLYAHFGSRGLYCLDMEGKVLWEKDFGDMTTRNGFGEGSSPALDGDTLIVNWDHEGDSFIVALDAKTGEERWRETRDEATSWSTPLIVSDGDTRLAIVPGSRRIRAYELDTGKVRWECGGLGSNCVPCPVERGGKIITMSGHRQPALIAIDYRGAKGDITDDKRVSWKLDGGTPYVPSPLLYDDTLYFLQKNTGILSCYNPDTGSPHYDKKRLEKITGVYASPVGANGRVYIVGRNGVTHVLKRGPQFEVLATNELEGGFDASPAIAGDELYLRGRKHLYCIASD